MPAKKPVVVATGVTSFVGMHLAQRFAREGFDVVGTISRKRDSYNGIRGVRLAALENVAELVELDITNPESVRAFIERTKPSLWLHHAGYADAYASQAYDLAKGYAANVAPLNSIYENLAERDCGVIITGSGAEYSASEHASWEDDACWPDMPYGASKLQETIRARQLAIQFSVPTRVARLYIPFGRFDNPDKLLAQVVTHLRENRLIDLSPCTQARDFIGVSDLCLAYFALNADLPRKVFDIFNICGGEPVVLKDFLLRLARRMNADPELLRFGARQMRAGEALCDYGGNEKARKILSWAPSDLSVAIERDLLEPEVQE